MTWQRVLKRNHLEGDYVHKGGHVMTPQEMLAGDLRRLEANQRDDWHLTLYAERIGITPEQVKAVLDAFFEADL